MEWLSAYFLVYDKTFSLTLWSLFLVSATLWLVIRAYKTSKTNLTTTAPLIHDAFLPTIIAKSHAPITYVACKKCGNHAVKVGDRTECLSISCRLNKK